MQPAIPTALRDVLRDASRRRWARARRRRLLRAAPGVGARLAADPATKRDGNPYLAWIEMYAGEDYQEVARGAAAHLDALAARRGGEDRFADLAKTFEAATVLERDFWQMGLRAANA